MDRSQARSLVEGARVARLGTVSPTGRAELVPVTFALVGDVVVTAVDHKPKTTTQLQRLDNIRRDPEVGLLVDHYDDADWTALWWVRLRGLARVVEDGEHYDRGIDALVGKYPQYREIRPAGPAILIEPIRWQWWSAV